MKKTLTTLAIIGASFGAFAQGTVVFENSAGSGNITLNNLTTLATPGTYTLALLFNSATSGTIPLSSLTAVASYTPTAANNDGPGYFYDPSTVNTLSGSGSGTFEVAGWMGTQYTTYAQALTAGVPISYTAEFVNAMGNPNPPATAPIPLSGGGGVWDGNLVITAPEPSTFALGGLGAAALLLFRRRK
jgi:hypothetical protein